MRFWKKENVAYPDREMESKLSLLELQVKHLEKKLAAVGAEKEILSQIIEGDQTDAIDKLNAAQQSSARAVEVQIFILILHNLFP